MNTSNWYDLVILTNEMVKLIRFDQTNNELVKLIRFGQTNKWIGKLIYDLVKLVNNLL